MLLLGITCTISSEWKREDSGMSTPPNRPLVSALRETWDTIFNPMSSDKTDEKKEPLNGHKAEEGSGGVSGTPSSGERNERWYDKMEGRVDENAQMTQENNLKLGRIDERTAWIARIIFAVFVAFVVSVGAGGAVALVF